MQKKSSTTSIWMLKRHTVSEDFDLWISRFESYYRVTEAANTVKFDVLLQPWMMTLSKVLIYSHYQMRCCQITVN